MRSVAAGRLPLEIQDLVATYGAGPVLDGVSLDVAAGEIVALLGPSGCGKTTLLRCVAGLETPVSGTIRIGDELVTRGRGVPPERRPVGMVFQDGALFPHLSVLANVRYGMARAERRGHAAVELLELVGLADKAERLPGMLSGGEQQRVALARALARRPGVLLLDEPFASLDTALRAQLRGEVRGLLKEVGVTTVLVTHDQHEALMFGDRVAVMRAGRLEQVDTPTRLYRQPASSWVAGFVGEANLLAGQVVDRGIATAVGTVPAQVAGWAARRTARPRRMTPPGPIGRYPAAGSSCCAGPRSSTCAQAATRSSATSPTSARRAVSRSTSRPASG